MSQLETALVGYIIGFLIGALLAIILMVGILIEANIIKKPSLDWIEQIITQYNEQNSSLFIFSLLLGFITGLGGSAKTAS